MPSKLIFLPGASGNTEFWRPAAELIQHPAERVFLGWPGIGSTPSEADTTSIGAFVERTVASIDRPTALVAQSMGGVIAILAAHQRPELVTHLVLSALCAGVDTIGLGAREWRPQESERTAEPQFVFANYCGNLESELRAFTGRTLLLWGDADPISPVRVGQHVASLLHHGEMHVMLNGSHTFANTHANEVARHIDRHLSTGT